MIANGRVTTLYQIIHDAIHKKSGQDGPLKLQYIRTEKESVMGWASPQFIDYFKVKFIFFGGVLDYAAI
jgi:hypothetical protein